MALFVLPSIFAIMPAAAATDAALVFTTPGAGDRIEMDSAYDLAYLATPLSASHVAGRLTLDGIEVATFIVNATPGNTTRIHGYLDTSGASLGDHILHAEAWTENTRPVAADVAVHLEAYDAPPTLWLTNASYDENARVLRVTGATSDSDGAVASVSLALDGVAFATLSSPADHFDVRFPMEIRQGTHYVSGAATDGIKVSTDARAFTVRNALPVVTITSVSHGMGGHILASGTATDIDGVVRLVKVSTPYGVGYSNATGGTWSVDIVGDLYEGPARIDARAFDDWNASTSASTVYNITGQRGVAYDRTFTIQAGAYADGETVSLPIVRNGTFSASPGGAVVGSTLHGAMDAELSGARSSEYILTPYGDDYQGIDVHLGTTLTTRWAFAGSGTVHIVLEGTIL